MSQIGPKFCSWSNRQRQIRSDMTGSEVVTRSNQLGKVVLGASHLQVISQLAACDRTVQLRSEAISS